jgi:dipeptide/tripeptide permease
MPDGTHCPECGKDVGFWAVALGVFRIRCPHCRASLYHAQSRRMNRATSLVAFGTVLGGLVAGALVGWWVRGHGVLVALVSGIAACAGLVFALGVLGQFAMTPLLRRTQRLAGEVQRGQAIDDETW